MVMKQYMLSYTTWLVSKMDLVKYIFKKPALTGRIARWQVLLLEFDIVYVTQKAVKGSTLADYLPQQPISDYQPMHLEFPDEDIMALFEEESEDEDKEKWIIWFDGASNALGHGIGAERVERPETYKQWQVRNQRAGFKQLPLAPEHVNRVNEMVKKEFKNVPVFILLLKNVSNFLFLYISVK